MEKTNRNPAPCPHDDKDGMAPMAAAAILDGLLESGAVALTRAEKDAIRMGAEALEKEAGRCS